MAGMFAGLHAIIYSADAEADRAFFRDVLRWEAVDAGSGWLIFAAPPAELALHPAETAPGMHELFLMCADIEATLTALAEKGVETAPVSDEGWGLLSRLTLPDGSKLGFYQPRHPGPVPMAQG